jgi:hypothetical protein
MNVKGSIMSAKVNVREMDARYRRYEWGCGELVEGLTADEINVCYCDWSGFCHESIDSGNHYRRISGGWTPWGVYDRVERPFAEGIECIRRGTRFSELYNKHSRARCSEGYTSFIFQPEVDTEAQIREGVIEMPNLHPVLKDRLLYTLDIATGKKGGFYATPSLWEETQNAEGVFCDRIVELHGDGASFDPALIRAGIETSPFLTEKARENLLYNLGNFERKSA